MNPSDQAFFISFYGRINSYSTSAKRTY